MKRHWLKIAAFALVLLLADLCPAQMMLRQSTARVIPFGPFVSPSDGVTLVTSLVSALDNGSTGIMIAKNGGALAVRHASVTASTYDAYGNYLVTLDTTDTGTPGHLRVQFAAAASCLPVWQDFEVVPAGVWDSLMASSGGSLPVNATAIGGTTQTGRDLGAGVLLSVGTGAGQVNVSGGTVPASGNWNTTTPPTVGAIRAEMDAASTKLANLDATVSSRSTFASGGNVNATQWGGVNVGGIPNSGAVALQASQHVIVDSGAVTTLTNLPAVPAGWLTATGISAGALNGKGDWSLAGTAPSWYTTPDNTLTLTSLGTTLDARHVDLTHQDRLDAAVSTRSTYTGGAADSNAAAIKAQTDKIAGLDAVKPAHTPLIDVDGKVTTSNPAVSGGPIGAGSISVTIPFTDATGNPIANAAVWVSTDAAGKNVVAGTLQTNTLGKVRFLLDDGVTYYVWLSKSGINPITARQFVARADP